MATNTLWTVNGTVQEKVMNAKDMLTSNPPGAYTTARTVDVGTAVFQLKFHLDRLATSMQLMREQQSKGGPEAHDSTGTAEVATRVHHAIVSGVRDYRARFPDAVGSNLRLTVLVTWPQPPHVGAEPTHTVASEAAGKASGGGGGGGGSGSGGGSGGGGGGGAVNAEIDGKGDGGAGEVTVHLHIELLPPPPTPPIIVEVSSCHAALTTPSTVCTLWWKQCVLQCRLRVCCWTG
jgi:hypothetical protein